MSDTPPRVLSELTVLLRAPDGTVLDERAFGREISATGLEVETQADLQPGQNVSFELELYDGERAQGEARVRWAKPGTFARAASLETIRMPGADRRRLNRLLRPAHAAWEQQLERLFFVSFLIVVTVAVQRLITGRSMERQLVIDLAPRALAAIAMGWSLLGLLRR